MKLELPRLVPFYFLRDTTTPLLSTSPKTNEGKNTKENASFAGLPGEETREIRFAG